MNTGWPENCLTQLPNSQPEDALLLLMQFIILLPDSGQLSWVLPGCHSHFAATGNLYTKGDFQGEGTVYLGQASTEITIEPRFLPLSLCDL